MHTEMEPECLRRLSRLALDRNIDVSRRALAGEVVADVEPLHNVLQPDAAKERVGARPYSVFPQEVDRLDGPMQRLVAPDMVCNNRHATCCSVAIQVLHGFGRMVAYNRAANVQVELGLGPMPGREAMVSRVGGVLVFLLVGFVAGFWQVPLAGDAHFFFLPWVIFRTT